MGSIVDRASGASGMTSTSLRSIREAAAANANAVEDGCGAVGGGGGVWQADTSMTTGTTRRRLILVMLYTITLVNVKRL
jgi:hypothetical protein